MARRCRIIILMLLAFCMGSSVLAAELTVNKIAAVVNGDMITLHELRMHTAAELSRRRVPRDSPSAQAIQQEVLDSLINDILFRQEAKRYQVTVSSAEAKEEVDRIIQRSGMSPAQFEAELKQQGLSMDMYAERMTNNMLRQRMANYMIDRKVFVTREDVADYFAKNKDQFAGHRTADFSILMLPPKVNAPKVYKDLTSGSLGFEDAAKQYSADSSSAEGGRIAGVPWANLPEDMQKLLSSLQDGKLSPLMKTQGGFVVVRRDAINEAKPLTLQEATPQIEEILLRPLREERFKEYTKQLRDKAVIDIRL